MTTGGIVFLVFASTAFIVFMIALAWAAKRTS